MWPYSASAMHTNSSTPSMTVCADSLHAGVLRAEAHIKGFLKRGHSRCEHAKHGGVRRQPAWGPL